MKSAVKKGRNEDREGEKVGKENIDITARVRSYDKDIVMTLKEQSLGDDTKECAIQAAHLSALCLLLG